MNRTAPEPENFWNLRTAPHQDQRNLKNLAPTRTERSADQAVRGFLSKTIVKGNKIGPKPVELVLGVMYQTLTS